MTETEAKTKWCPMVRFGVAEPIEGEPGQFDAQTSTNRPKTGHRGNCIGSACMMWRRGGGSRFAYHYSDSTLNKEPVPAGAIPIKTETVDDIDHITMTTFIYSEEGGHCGLAGKP